MNDENVRRALSWLRESMDELTNDRDRQTMVKRAIYLLDPPPPPKPSQAERIADELVFIVDEYSTKAMMEGLRKIANILREKP